MFWTIFCYVGNLRQEKEFSIRSVVVDVQYFHVKEVEKKKLENESFSLGIEPTRAEYIGLAVQRLNHSATSSLRLVLAEIIQFIRECDMKLFIKFISFHLIEFLCKFTKSS